MKLAIQVDTEDGATSECVSFEGDVTDLAAAALVLLANVSGSVSLAAARFAEKSLTALDADDPAEAGPSEEALSGSV